MEKQKIILFLKIFIFIYILISPFINNTWIIFINSTFIKITILILIVLIALIDLQLAILCMIAFLIIIVNLNKTEINNMYNRINNNITQEKEQMIRGHSIYPLPSDIFQPPLTSKITSTSDISQFSNQPQDLNYIPTYRRNYDDSNDGAILRNNTGVNQTISTFPKPYCNIIEYDPILISKSISDYSLDYHTKPYEEYIRYLTPEMAKEIIT